MTTRTTRLRHVVLLRDVGYTYNEVGAVLGITGKRARDLWEAAMFDREAAPGFLDSPAEMYLYERWGDRFRPRVPGAGRSIPGIAHVEGRG